MVTEVLTEVATEVASSTQTEMLDSASALKVSSSGPTTEGGSSGLSVLESSLLVVISSAPACRWQGQHFLVHRLAGGRANTF